MSKIFLFSNSFDDTFGGMEEHRKAFVSYFEKDVDYDLFLLSNADSESKPSRTPKRSWSLRYQ